MDTALEGCVRHAAVHHQALSNDVAGLIAAKQCAYGTKLVDVAEPVGGDSPLVNPVLYHLLVGAALVLCHFAEAFFSTGSVVHTR